MCSNCNQYDWSRVSGGALGVVQISVGNPAIVTAPNQLVAGSPVVFSAVGGSLPAPMQITQVFYVIPIDASHFSISATLGGPPVATTTPATGQVYCDPVVLGCHYPAPDEQPSTGITAIQARWRPVDADNWCSYWAPWTPDGTTPSQLPAVSGVAAAQPNIAVTADTMLGLGLVTGFSITPVLTGRIAAVISGTLTSSTANAQVNVTGRHGTGTAPANGAGAVGALWAATQHYVIKTSADVHSFTVIGGNPGLAIGVPVWFDVSIASPAGGISTIADAQSLLFEL